MLPPEDNFKYSAPDPFPVEITELVNAVRRGEISAFEQLYRHYYPEIYRYLLFCLRQATQTELLTEQVFRLVWRTLAINSSLDARHFSLWLYRLAYQLFTGHLIEQDYFQANFTSETEDLTIEIQERNKTNLQTEKLQNQPLVNLKIRQGLQRLEHEQQLLLYLLYIEQRSPGEVAHLLDCPEQTILSKKLKALQALNAILDAERQ
jgi:RNA polymerase sigma-70 factor (ECF subfamily)